MGTDRAWGGWPVWPPKPPRSTLREHRLAEPPSRATCAAWGRRTFPESAGWSQVVDLAVALLLFAFVLVLVGVLVESTDRREPETGPPAPAVGLPLAAPEPPLLLDGTPFEGEGGVHD